MLFNKRILALAALFSTLTSGRPFDSAGAGKLVARSKSYAVVNVGGDSTETSAEPTSTIKTTTTIEVVIPGETVTREVTATVVKPNPAPVPTPCPSSSSVAASSSSLPVSSTSTPISSTPPISTPNTPMSVPSNSTSMPIETPKPIFITVTVSEDDGPTEYYDNGMWHTNYRIKTFEDDAVAAPTAPPTA
ncbi:hypothetical protein COCC4DRAFT_32162 [Bipolaris maydis ATCC 48331]|uniref:Uncharacterized protein n=2 Tax=Cochliobolus heterostrophus TaxID=5016 RepID=M2TRU9_COCH5|nr:uncharacterized protein COCC4DRAFT_32162 [Bipolaris maydis ATCC 48331]EMD89244.1 hypothetical protein COCHEDRAFT_1022686 [Bipolaris maydis C5]KAH7552598.1 hypothetical protein BM1_08549 [Bipolaris maydis]ENI05039.1 hypothetical protein COCC4DRAFT_32162 [Bipolaris maydis ATCC 48331]KAJ5024897.1 hypothetical protein J3E73DRAFT_323578 [Bipolaris maydis]KAJ5057114.1 hypothetical protein J3E74DRAFT_369816 [Bipolaris maydis]